MARATPSVNGQIDRDLWEIRANESKNIGSNFEEGLLEEAAAVAVKRVIAWQIAEKMKGC